MSIAGRSRVDLLHQTFRQLSRSEHNYNYSSGLNGDITRNGSIHA